ncbi:MAG: hypothetical protein ACI4HN_07140 [Ruminococcus sp.]
MKIQIIAVNINYSEIFSKLSQSDSEKKDGNFFSSPIGKLIGGGINILPDSMKDAMVKRVFDLNRTAITAQINKKLSDNEIELEIKDAVIEGGSKLMKIQLDVDNVNYNQIIVKFLPQIIGLIPKNDKTTVFTDALDIVGDRLDVMVNDLLDNLDCEQKEQLLRLFVNHFNPKISSILNKLIANNGITAEIDGISVL